MRMHFRFHYFRFLHPVGITDWDLGNMYIYYLCILK